MILLRADNHGEGGTLALMALAQRAVSKGAGAIVLLGIISGALFYGDAVITPALSVLSAIEGIKLVTATFDPYVVPLTVVILVVLFAVQSRGTAQRRGVLRPGDVRLVRGHCGRGRCRRSSGIPKCCWRSIRSMRFHSCSITASSAS